ncbi:MAG: PKD domain-containing protein, partial [Anaerolineales bacterium]|nr:PKD domain-containing protein [Anaerolineales bacterium]
MNIKQFLNNLAGSPRLYTVTLVLVILLWSLTLIVVGGFLFLFVEQSSQAQLRPSDQPIASMVVEPAVGLVGDRLTVQGSDWPTGTTVYLYLTTPEAERIPTYAVTEATVDAEGHFTATFELLPATQWADQKSATVIARSEDGQVMAQANFTILSLEPEPTATPDLTPTEPTATSEPAATPVPTIEPSATPNPTPTSTPEPSQPPARLTSTVNLNVREGPGLDYAIIGLLRPGQSAQIIAVSPDGGWWQIEFPTATGDYGWVSAHYVIAENTDGVPAAYTPPLLATPTPVPTQESTATPLPPTPTPAPIVISDWRGDYFRNPNLSGGATVTRNDVNVSFNWGFSSPHPDIPADNFSVKWTRSLHFDEGTYRFHAWVDDGVRFYIDDALVIDSWYDSSAHEVTGDRWLGWGTHSLRIEYYEHTGEAVIQTWWEQLSTSSSNAPRARFSVDDKNGPAPFEVDFDNDSEGDYDSCKWDFGDGDTSSRCSDRTHTYDKPGKYDVKLRVRGPGGEDTEKKSDYITVRPVAKFTSSPVSGQPLQIRFTNQSEFYDSFDWDFGDGATSTAANPTHTYTAAGSYLVKLRVKDEGVWSNTTSQTVAVTSDRPQAAFSANPTSGPVPLTVNFTNTSSGDYTACLWNFGDGATDATCGNPAHIYTTAGTFSVQLTVEGPGGSDVAGQTNLIQAGQPAKADFSAAPTDGAAPLAVTFSNLSTGDYDSCMWLVEEDYAQAGCDDFTYTYTTPGDKTVSLTINGPGGRDEMIKPNYISVVEAPAPPPTSPVAKFVADPLTGSAPLDVHFINRSDGEIETYLWDFGDGDSSSDAEPTHTYAATGSYSVGLTVTGPGGSDTKIRRDYIIVGDVPPVARFVAEPLDGVAPLVVVFDNRSDGVVTDSFWQFGDGETSTASDPTHTYVNDGNFSVSLTVTGPGGSDTQIRANYITVAIEPEPAPPALEPRVIPAPTPTVEV